MAGSNKKSATKSEAAPAVSKDTKPLKKGKREPKDDSETKVNLKKPKKDVIAPSEDKKSDQKEIMKGFADCLQPIEAKVDLLATKADLHAIFISENVEKVSAMKPPAKDTCLDDEVTATVKANTENTSSSEDESSSDEEPAKKLAARAHGQSISVKGFDSSLPVADIKSALSKHFSSFGEITRVFVPRNPETGASLGYAYIDLKEGADKALELGGHDVGGWDLVVGKAEPRRSGSSWPYPGRCGNLGRCRYC